jgi:hypothetical protein
MTEIDVSKMKNAGGKLLTAALFWEVGALHKEHNTYTLDSRDLNKTDYAGVNKVLPSIQRLYIEENDPTEYNFAVKYFYDFRHWQQIKESAWFQDTYKSMQDALAAKIASQSVQEMLELVESKKAGHQTLAWLANKGYLEKEKVGRPNKKAVEKQAAQAVQRKVEEQQELDELLKHDPKLAKLIKK